MTTEPKRQYHVTLRCCEEGKFPIVTPYNIGKRQYDAIQAIIHEQRGDVIVGENQRKLRKGGGRG